MNSFAALDEIETPDSIQFAGRWTIGFDPCRIVSKMPRDESG
jgi:hypothetical protein